MHHISEESIFAVAHQPCQPIPTQTNKQTNSISYQITHLISNKCTANPAKSIDTKYGSFDYILYMYLLADFDKTS